jgi:RNA polymerase sigma-54 factor
MALSHRLNLKQQQSLVMTPQLQEAIKLLQMSNIELAAYIEEELEQNPLLERDDTEPEEHSDAMGEKEAQADENLSDDSGFDDSSAEPVDSLELANAESLPDTDDAPLDSSYDDVWDRDSSPTSVETGPDSYDAAPASSKGSTGFDNIDDAIESRVSENLTLRDHLTSQLNVDFQDPADRIIGLYLIELLDEAGRLVGNLEEAADRLGSQGMFRNSVARKGPAGSRDAGDAG